MKCGNCNISIANKFSFAIKNNQCPACGRHIMEPEKLASYNRLQELIKNNFSGIDVEKLANLVVANFELKQLFKESNVNEDVVEVEDESPNEVEVVEVEEEKELTDEEYDAAHKSKQIEEAKKLKRMKEEAYKDALRAQYGMGDIEEEGDVAGSGSIFGEDVNPVELADRMKQAQKQNDSQRAMSSGSGGFRRSDV